MKQLPLTEVLTWSGSVASFPGEGIQAQPRRKPFPPPPASHTPASVRLGRAVTLTREVQTCGYLCSFCPALSEHSRSPSSTAAFNWPSPEDISVSRLFPQSEANALEAPRYCGTRAPPPRLWAAPRGEDLPVLLSRRSPGLCVAFLS